MSNAKELCSWQRHDWQKLQSLLLTHPKAILFSHVAGIAEDIVLHYTIRYLLCLCENFSLSCTCSSCAFFQNNLFDHPDVLFFNLDNKKGGIELIREILDKDQLLPHVSKRRVIILQQAHYLSITAQNALLKSLESTQGGCYLLTSTQKNGLLLTLRSRIIQYNFSLPTKEEFTKYLSPFKVDQKQINLLWKLTAGAPVLAKNWVEQNRLQQYAFIIKLLQQLLLQQICPIVMAEKCIKIDPVFFGKVMLQWWGEVIVWVVSKPGVSAKTQLQSLFQAMDIKNLDNCYQAAVNYYKYTQLLLNKTLNLENLLICFIQKCAIS